MHHEGYRWAVREAGQDWVWTLTAREDGATLVQGRAPTRAVAAAMVVRAIARGMTTDIAEAESLAA